MPPTNNRLKPTKEKIAMSKMASSDSEASTRRLESSESGASALSSATNRNSDSSSATTRNSDSDGGLILNPYSEVCLGISPNTPPPDQLSSSTSGYTVDSRCELIRTHSGKEGHPNPPHPNPGAGHPPSDSIKTLDTCTQCPNSCANIKTFIFACCLFASASGALSGGYVSSVITTIEKRFEIGSLYSGLISASAEFGSLVAVMFVSYLGGGQRIPKWIGCGAVLQGIGALVFTLPHLLAEAYTVTGGLYLNRTSDDNICRAPDSHMTDLYEEQKCISKGSYGNAGYVLLLIGAQVMIGAGASPLLTLGTTYVDDHVSKEQAPAHIAPIYACGALGPVLGFALGALTLQYYVDGYSFDIISLNIDAQDPRWVGCWWAGFLVCGVILLLISCPFYAFPRVLVRERKKLEEGHKEPQMAENMEKLLAGKQVERSGQQGRSIKELPRTLCRLLSNPVYVLTCLGICCEIAIVCGFVVFLPKYLETQFTISKSLANLLTGVIAIPGAAIGILVGGYLLKRFNLSPRGAVQLALTLNLSALIGFVLFFFIGCDNLKMAGATQPYFNSTPADTFISNLTSSCNINCGCSGNIYDPICGINGVTYFSPCHAGCTKLAKAGDLNSQNYTDCTCILENMNLSEDLFDAPVAVSGPCENKCTTLLPFMFMLFVMTTIVAGTQMPLLMVTLRSVSEEDRAFALGIQFVFLRLFAYIPSPIFFGNTIDGTCVLWNERCGNSGSCLLYDREAFRYKYAGLAAGLKVTGALFFTSVLCLLEHSLKQDFMHGSPSGGDIEQESRGTQSIEPVVVATEESQPLGGASNFETRV